MFVWFFFTSSCLQQGSCLTYVICVCSVRLYLLLFVVGLMSYLRYLCLFGSSLPPVVCSRAHVLLTLFVFVWFFFTSSCLQQGSCLTYVICVCSVPLYLQLFVVGLMFYLRYLCLFGSSLPPVVCSRAHVLLTLFVFVWFFFTSSCLQQGSCLTYVICVCSVLLYLQLFVVGLMSYLRYLCLFGSSLPPVVCSRAHVLLTLFVFVRFFFTSSCLQQGSCFTYVICVCLVLLYLQLFVVGLMSMSYLRYLCLFGSSLPPVVCSRAHVLLTLFVFVWFFFTSSCLQQGSCLTYVICVCSVRLYLLLFVVGLMSYLRYLCLFGSSLPPVVCSRAHVLLTLFVFVWFFFTSSCLQQGSCLTYVICVCSVLLYLQLFVVGLMFYLRYLCLFGSSLPPVVCSRAHVLFTLFVFVWFFFTSSCLQQGSCLTYVICVCWFFFTSSCLQQGSCLTYVICVCLVLLYLQLFVVGLMSYLRYLCLFGSSLPPVVCSRAHVLLTLFVFVWFFFTSSCLQQGSCLTYVICVCLVLLYLQLFVVGLMSYLRYLCLFGSSLPPVVCSRAHVLLTLFVFVRFFFTSSCLTYVICVCLVRLYLQLFVVGLMSYLRYLCLFGSSLPPVVCSRAHVLLTLFVFVVVFTSSCLQQGSCLTYVICVCLVRLYLQLFKVGLMSYLRYLQCLVLLYLQLFVVGLMSYLRYLCLFGSSLPPVVCSRAHVLLTLFVFVRFFFTSSCLQQGSCLTYVICVCLVLLYLQLFVVGLMSYLRYLCLFGSSLPPVVCSRAHVLLTLFVFVWFFFTSSCLQQGSCLTYVICVCLVLLYLQLFVVGLLSYLRYLCLFGSSLPPVVCSRAHVLLTLFVFVWFFFTSSCLQQGSCLTYVICVCSVLLYLQLFVVGLMFYLRYLCLFGSSLPPVVCSRAHVLLTLFVFVWFFFTSSCLQQGSCLTYVICVCSSCLQQGFFFTSSCLQQGSCFTYVICVCLVLLYLQLFVVGLMSYLRYLCLLVSYLRYLCLFGSSLPPVVCSRAHVLLTLFVFVWFVFTSSCLQQGSCLTYVICVCSVLLYLQLFVVGLMSYLRYLCLFGSSLPPVVCSRAHVLLTLFVFVWFFFTSSCLQQGSCLTYVICVCSVLLYLQLFVVGSCLTYVICVCLVRLYLQLFKVGLMSYLRYLCLFGSSLPPVVCSRAHVLLTLFVFVRFVFTSSCLQQGSCFTYVICVCLVLLYLQLFVVGLMSYLRYLCLFGSSLPPVVCSRAHVLLTLFVFVWFVFTSSCLQQGSCLTYVICVCLVRLYLQLFVVGLMSYLRYLCLFGSSLPPVVCSRAHVLLTLFVFVWFVFTSSCLKQGSCLTYVICVCLVLLYLQLFVVGLMSYLRYLCLFGSSLPPVVCSRAHVLLTLFVFVRFFFTSSCLQQGSCLTYVICVCLVLLYLQLFVVGLMSYLRYLCLFGSSLPPVVCSRAHVLLTLFVFVWFFFTSSCLQQGSCLTYVICVCLVLLYLQLFVVGLLSYLRYLCLFGSSLPPVVCSRAHVLLTLFVFVWFFFTSSCLQQGSCLTYVICVCSVLLYLQLFVVGLMFYLRYLCLFGSSLPPVVCSRAHVLLTLFVFVWFFFTSSCLQQGSCLTYVICVCLVLLYLQLFVVGLMFYLRYLCLLPGSLFVFVWFFFTSSCLQQGSCLTYVICVCLVRLYLQLFVVGLLSYLRYLCLFGSSLPPVVCSRAHVLLTLFVFVWFVFTSSCLQQGSCLTYVICVCLVLLYLQLFVVGLMSYLRYLCLFGSSLPPVVCSRAHVLLTLFVFVWFVFTSSCLQQGSCLTYVICVCSVLLYLQLFVGGLMSYLCYLCLFGSSLPPVVCSRAHVLLTLFVFVRFFFTSSCLQQGSCLTYVICVCLVRLYLQLFVVGLMSYLRYLCLFGSSLPPVVCSRAHVLLTLFVFVRFFFTSSCLQQGSCLTYVICVCLVRLYLQLFVVGLMSYLHYLCLFGSSLPPVVCRRAHVLLTLFVFVWFVFTSSCLQQGSCLTYVICVCLVRLYLQLFVVGLMSYLRYLCLFGSSLPPVVCSRAHVLLTLFVFVWFVFTSSCLQQGSCLTYVICVCLVLLYLQLFVVGLMSYLRYLCLFGSSLPPVVCSRAHVLLTLFVFVWFFFTSSCLQQGSCLTYVICVCLVLLYLQLFVVGLMSYLRYLCLFGSSLPPVVCSRAHVLLTLFVFVWFFFTSSCLQQGSCLTYVICVCLVRLYLQLFVVGLMSYLRYLCLFGSSLPPVVCSRAHVLLTLFVFVWFFFTSSCLQQGSCLTYVICVCLVLLYLQLFVVGLMSYLRYLCLFGSSLPPVVCSRAHVLLTLFVFVWFFFTSSCLQQGSCLTYVICVCSVLLYLQLFVVGLMSYLRYLCLFGSSLPPVVCSRLMSYLRYLCLFGSSLPPVVCSRAHVLLTLFVFVWFVFTSSCLQQGSCLTYVICVCSVLLYLQLFVVGLMSYLRYLCLFGSSLPPVVCSRAHVLLTLFVFVRFFFTSSCLQQGSCFTYVICVCLVLLYLQLFVVGLMSYLRYLCLFGSSLPPVVCSRAHVLLTLFVFVWVFFTSSCLQQGSCLTYVICVCLVLLYLQLFVVGLMSYLRYLCLFGSSLPPVVLLTLFVFVWFVFTSSCLQQGSCLTYVICVCLVRLYLQLFVVGLMSYLRYLCLFGSSLPPVVCSRAHVLLTLFVFVWFVFTSSCLQQGSCLTYVICVCLVLLYLQLFVVGLMSYLRYLCLFGSSLPPVVCSGLMSYLRYLCLFGSSLPPVVCSRAHVLLTLFVFVWFFFTSSCLQQGSCLTYVICVCSVRLYLQLFVVGLMFYLRYLCLFGSSLPPVVCSRAHVLLTLFVFVRFFFTSSCLQQGSCLTYVICVCLVRLYLQLFVVGLMSYLRYLCLFGSSLPPVVCSRAHVLLTLFVFVRFFFTSSCLQWAHVLLTLFVFVWFVFTSSCLKQGSCLTYVICVCLVLLYLQLFVVGLMSYLRYLCLFGSSLPPVVCSRAHVLLTLFVFVWFFFTSSCLQQGSCLTYVICVCLVLLYLQLFVVGLMSYLRYLCLFGSSLPPVVCSRAHVLLTLFVFVWFVFTSSCLQQGSCLTYVICVCLVRLYLQLFVVGLMSYLRYLCLFGSSLPPVV